MMIENISTPTPGPKEAVLIVNTHSRRGERLFFRALDLLQNHGIDIVESYPVRKPEQLRKIVQRMIDEGHSLIIVGGGDGTFHTITELFAHKEVILGILPLGTANNFARSLGIPMDLDKAVEVICNGNVVPVDLGVINNQYFINIASIGFSKQVINATPRRLKQYLGIIAYILYETKFLLTQELFDCTIKTDEKAEKLKTRQIIIANGSFYGTRKVHPEASLDDDKLFIFMMDSENEWQGLKFWIGFLLGRHLSFPESKVYITKSVSIETIPKKYVIMGGEKFTHTPVQISVDHRAVRAMGPSKSQNGS